MSKSVLPGASRLVPHEKVPITRVKALPQCEAPRTTLYCKAWEQTNPDKRCKHSARYRIDGKNLCGRHAGILALNVLLGEKL